MDWLGVLLAGLNAIVALLGLIKTGQERAAGRDEVKAGDAKAEAEAQTKISTIATQGQDDAQTISDLRDGSF
jgi:hypothetical protein